MDNEFILIINTKDTKEYQFTNESISICQSSHNISSNTVYLKLTFNNN